MRKFICALLAFVLLCAGAAAAEGEFRAGARAALVGDSLFFSIGEGQTGALVRVSAAGKPMLAARAQAVGSLVSEGDQLFFLSETDGAWSLLKRGETGASETIVAFDAGVEARALSAFGDNLFVLLDDQLHIIYPAEKLCLRLAGARMSEYAVVNDYAYFVSVTDVVTYEIDSASGPLSRDAGCLYRLNLSTGNTSLVMKAGCADLLYRGGKLYFHNYSDAYVSGEESAAHVSGKLYSFDLSSETLACALDDYDWAYFPTDGGILVYRAGGVSLVTPDGETPVCETGPRAEVFFANGAVLVYDPDAGTFAAWPVAGAQ